MLEPSKNETRTTKAINRALTAIRKGKSKFCKRVVLARIPLGLESLENSMSLNIPCTGDIVADNLVITAIGAAAITNIKRPDTTMSSIFKSMLDMEDAFHLSTNANGIQFVVDEDLDDVETVSAIQSHNLGIWYNGTDGFTRDHVKPYICTMIMMASLIANGANNFSMVDLNKRRYCVEWILESIEDVVENAIDAHSIHWSSPIYQQPISFASWMNTVKSVKSVTEINMMIQDKTFQGDITIPLFMLSSIKVKEDAPCKASSLDKLVQRYIREDEERMGA